MSQEALLAGGGASLVGGTALAGLATVLGPSDAMYSSGRSFGFLAVMFGATGLVLGGLLFVMADAVAQRRR